MLSSHAPESRPRPSPSAITVALALSGTLVALIPVGISIMRDELREGRMGSAVALMSATLGIGSAMGLPLAGVLYESLGWASIF